MVNAAVGTYREQPERRCRNQASGRHGAGAERARGGYGTGAGTGAKRVRTALR